MHLLESATCLNMSIVMKSSRTPDSEKYLRSNLMLAVFVAHEKRLIFGLNLISQHLGMEAFLK